MRTILLILVAVAGGFAQLASAPAPLSAKDDAAIRAAIDDQAKKDNLKGSGQIWSERGPLTFRIRTMEALTRNVAMVDAVGVRTGPFPERQPYAFIMTRVNGAWVVAREIAVCVRPGVQLLDSM